MSSKATRQVIMTRKLTKVGNSQGLLIPQSVMELLGFTMDTDLEVVTDGYGLFVFPEHHPDLKKLRLLPRAELSRVVTESD